MPPDKIVRQPIYQQLNTILKTIISENGLTPGDRFLSERDICNRYGVSRATANKAICALVAEGVLTYKKGVGTYVADKPLHYDLSQLISFTAKAKEAGKVPSTSVLVFDELRPADLPANIQTTLKPDAEETVYYFERLRFADNIPVIYEKRYLRAKMLQPLRAAELCHSLYTLIESRTHLSIKLAEQTISAVIPNKKEAKLLEIQSNIACFQIRGTGFLESGQPIWHETTLYRGDVYEFSGKLGSTAALIKGTLHQ